MAFSNNSQVYEFVLVGFPSLQKYSTYLFMALLCIYLFIIDGNLLIFYIIHQEPSLHSPMYLFIGALSCLEICYTCVTIPKMLADLLNEEKTISFEGCFVQVYFIHALGISEACILMTMAYDRYLAICIPLQYNSIMTVGRFITFLVCCFIAGFLLPTIEVALVSPLPFCGPNQIENVFCDIIPLIALACTDTSSYAMFEFCISIIFFIISFPLIILSYFRIFQVILKIKTKAGRQKAYSTCGPHLIIVILFFGSAASIYWQIFKRSAIGFNKMANLIFSVFTPLANPLIYGLRNQQIKSFIKKYLCFA